MRNYLLFLLSIIAFSSCAPSRFVEPLPVKKISVGANAGGPILNFGGAPIPTPLSAIEVGYGLDTNLTIFTGIHTTAMLFGDIQIDAGATYKIVNQKKYKPNISISPSFNAIYSPSSKVFNIWPIIDANCYWNYGSKEHYFYVGLNNYFDLTTQRAFNQEPITHWLISPQVGNVIKGKNRSWEFFTELKWTGPTNLNSYAFVPYYGVAQRGAIGFHVGFRKLL